MYGSRRRTRGPKRGMATIHDLVPKVMPRTEPEDAILFRVMAFWERSLPLRLVRNARPASLKRGLLTVHASTSAWAQEVTLRSRDILERLRRGVPQAHITTLRAKTGGLPDRIVPPPPVKKHVVPARELPAELARSLEEVGDPELRALLAAAAATSLGRVVVEPREE